MKKFILLVLLIACIIDVYAIKAYPLPFEVQQKDGTTLTIRLMGDEHFSWTQTEDGILLVKDGDNYYVAQINNDGSLISTGQLAHNKENRGVNESSLISKQDKELFFSKNSESVSTRAAATIATGTYKNVVSKGSPRILVVLTNFADKSFVVNNPKAAFNEYLNAEGEIPNRGSMVNGVSTPWIVNNYGSVKKYFTDMSYGAFTPQFDVYGPVTLPRNMAYYGQNRGNVTDVNRIAFFTDALNLVSDSISDMGLYDTDKDDYIDCIYIIYAGYGESSGGGDDTLWPMRTTINGNYKGKRLSTVGISNELLGSTGSNINGIGVFCHEFSHCLGLPDFYTTTVAPDSVQNADNQSMGVWSLMDTGCYLYSSFQPSSYTAWEREALGWLTIEELKDTQQVTLTNIDEGGTAYRIEVNESGNQNDYYIIQNIQNTGWNEKAGIYSYSWRNLSRAHGMLVYHVNYDQTAFSLMSNSVNNVYAQPRMTVIPADSILLNSSNMTSSLQYYNSIRGDLFPGYRNITELTDAQKLPNFTPWNGTVLNKPIYNIKEENGVITFDFLQDFTTGISSITYNKTSNDERIYTIDGRYVGKDTSILPKGIYIIGNKKVII